MMVRIMLALALYAVLTGCARPEHVQRAAETVQQAVAPVAAEVQQTAVEAVSMPLIETQADVQAIVQDVVESPVQDVPAPAAVAPAAVSLLIEQEVVSPAYYQARLQGFACPGDISGPTIGIGYDLGVQPPARIESDWSVHPRVAALKEGSGVRGFAPCRAYRAERQDVKTPFPMAEQVFTGVSLPAYARLTERTFQNGWGRLPPNAQGALVVTVYARGASMRGESRAEMRRLRDECVPAADVQCIADAHIAMCERFRHRADGEGLCRRFRATARLAVQA